MRIKKYHRTDPQGGKKRKRRWKKKKSQLGQDIRYYKVKNEDRHMTNGAINRGERSNQLSKQKKKGISR